MDFGLLEGSRYAEDQQRRLEQRKLELQARIEMLKAESALYQKSAADALMEIAATSSHLEEVRSNVHALCSSCQVCGWRLGGCVCLKCPLCVSRRYCTQREHLIDAILEFITLLTPIFSCVSRQKRRQCATCKQQEHVCKPS
jgi:hypothetical protein